VLRNAEGAEGNYYERWHYLRRARSARPFARSVASSGRRPLSKIGHGNSGPATTFTPGVVDLLVANKYLARRKMNATAHRSTGMTQPERSALSDARMADAAVALICERGAGATTLKEVGLRAGYSRGLASYSFGSKAGLWSFLIRRIGEEWLAELQRAVAGTSGVETIHAAVDAHCRFLLDSPERIRAFYILWFESVGPDPALREVIAGAHQRRQRDVEEWIRAGIEAGTVRPDIDVQVVAEQFCAAIIGIVYTWLVSPMAHAEVKQLHAGLKQQMTMALSPGGGAGRPNRGART
jgi:AcrR family transcriptional regulator